MKIDPISIKIPLIPKDLTQEWLQDAFKLIPQYIDRRIEEFQLTPLDMKLGYMTTHLKGKVKLESNTTDKEGDILEIFVKMLPEEEMFRHVLRHMRFDLKEVRFYDTLLPEMQEFVKQKGLQKEIQFHVPTAIFVACSETEPESIVILRDANVDGFEPWDFRKDWTLDMLLAAARTLATIHSVSFAYFRAQKIDPLEKYPFIAFDMEKQGDSFSKEYIGNTLGLINKFLEPEGNSTDDKIREFFAILQEKGLEIGATFLTGEASAPLKCLKQCDSWNNNYLFRIANKDTSSTLEAMLVDWQWPTYGTPMGDLSTLLLTSTSKQIRMKHTEDIIEEYWMTFAEILQELGDDFHFTLEQAKEEYYETYLGSFFHIMMLSVAILRSSQQQEGGHTIKERYLDSLREMAHSEHVRRRLDRVLSRA